MTKDQMFDAIVDQRQRLISDLEGLTADEWDTMSLCSGWRARDVVGHLVSVLEIPPGRFVWRAVRARGFDRYADQVARDNGSTDPHVLLDRYRARATTRFAPPVIGPIAPLADVLVHTRDIERPLGRPADLDRTALMTVLDFLCGGRARGFVPSARTKGLRFEADDIGWSTGSGPTVAGTGEAIMMAVTGRTAALADLSGDGSSILAGRLR